MNDDGRLTPEIKAVAIVVVVGAIMSILDTTIVNVALETLSRELHADLSTIQWVSTAYLLALATVIPLTGWAAERFGPKRVWMTVVSGFVVSSALCGLAWSAESLIAFRVLQGLAGGMVMPVGMITLAQTAGPQRMGRVMSVVGVPMLLAPVLGPVIGGLIVEHLSWRWIFYVNLPIGIVGLALAARLLPSGRAEGLDATTKLDWRGLVLLSPGVAMLVFGLSEVGSQGSVSGVDLAWMVGGLALIAAFVLRALRVERPLVDVRLFRGRGFSAAAGTTFIVGMALFGSMLLLPLYFQVARGESPLHAGLLVAPQGLGAAFAMRFSGRMTDRVGGGRVVLIGLTILTARDDPLRAHRGRHALLAAGRLRPRPGRGPGLHDDAGDGGGLRDARAPAGAARDADAQRRPARRRVHRDGGARRRPAAPARRGRPRRRRGAGRACSPRRPRRAGAWPSRSRRPSATPTGGRSR